MIIEAFSIYNSQSLHDLYIKLETNNKKKNHYSQI